MPDPLLLSPMPIRNSFERDTASSSDDDLARPLLPSDSTHSSFESQSPSLGLSFWHRARRRTRAHKRLPEFCQKLIRHPLFPSRPITIIASLLIFTLFATALTLQLVYYFNSNKTPIPWRTFCLQQSAFPPPNFESIPPISIFLAVFTIDTGYDRRMTIRNSYASHRNSRIDGTERVILRFIMGRPRKEFERNVGLEMDIYNDIVILPIKENMNDGKTYSFFTWAYSSALVPPSSSSSPSNHTVVLAPHDPQGSGGRGWVQPDYIVKADDDSFIMLGELEARLRITPRKMTYWGFVVRKERFVAGQSYGLSFDLVSYIATTASLAAHVSGREDQVTASWIKAHPRAREVRWWDERCWIYDHPKAGTIYSHGFLFPSELERIRGEWNKWFSTPPPSPSDPPLPLPSSPTPLPPSIIDPSYSTVSTWKRRYSYNAPTTWASHYQPPHTNLTIRQSIEALVEGSAMSQVSPAEASAVLREIYERRERPRKRYAPSGRVGLGGTVVVHYVKKAEYWLECVEVLLGMREDPRPW